MQAGRPFGVCHGGLNGRFVKTQLAQGGDGDTGVLDLVRADQGGQGQVQQAGFILIDQATAFFPNMPVLAMHHQRRAKAVGGGLDHLQGLVRLRSDNAGHAAFDDARLFARDFGQGITQKLGVVDGDRRDHGQRRFVHHVGCVHLAAKADLEQGVIGRCFGKTQQGSSGGDFEIGDRIAVVGAIAAVQQIGQRGFGDMFARQRDAFVKARQMRRDIGVNRFPRTF